MARKPAVRGQFYPASADDLRTTLDSLVPADRAPEPALGALCPHAGYPFSGAVAGQTLASVTVPEAVLLLTPSHAYADPPFALWTGGSWQMPMGDVPMDEALTDALAEVDEVRCDDRPHLPEHAGEVVLPFLQYLNPDVGIAVLCVTVSARLQGLLSVGAAVADIARAHNGDVLIVTSSDMSHESGASARAAVERQDPLAIDRMRDVDAAGLHDVCRRTPVTMCGVLPATLMLAAVRELGGTEGELVARATSADSPLGGGDYVVGYAGMVFR